MTKRNTANKAVNNLIYYLFCGFSGAIIAAIVWVFLRVMSMGIEFVWSVVPQKLDFKFYPLIVCGAGGLIVGIFQKITKTAPEDLETVITKIKKDKFYPYNKVLILCVSALLPLILGGSIGPEAGLTGVIAGLCYWAGSHMKYARNKIPELMQIGISSTLGAIFYAPLFALAAPNEERIDSDDKPQSIHTSKLVSNLIAVLCSVGMLYLLRTCFGGNPGLSRISNYNITNTERIWGIPLAVLSSALGLLFILFKKVCSAFFGKLKNKAGIIVSATLGGVILGIAGTYLPPVMFSGEESIAEIQLLSNSLTPWLLITTGLVKLLMTNICIESGWKGGHFFPVIFCGISIGFGVGAITGLDPAFCAAVVTAGLLGTTMKKPLSVTLLLLLCFDVRIVPWILIAALAGSIIPIGKKKAKA